MEFMAGTEMTPEKAEAHEQLARLCEEQARIIGSIGSVAGQLAEAFAAIAADAATAAAEREEAASAVRARAEGARNAALAEASNGNWSAVKLAERMGDAAGKAASLSGVAKEEADGAARDASDILYHLTN